MEPLSKPLTDWLIKLNLCTRADLRRCQGRVRQLARDVPAFDSVWIDALVHARKLTPFQAKLLESGEPNRLAIGPCVLVDQLGHGMSTTYLARHLKGNERCVLKIITIPKEEHGLTLELLRQLVNRAERLSHPAVIAPQSCLAHQNQLVTVSRYIAGPPLNQLLVRRGRFPARIVLALAKQLVDGLAALEEHGVLHGDLRLQNLRLDSSGRVVMVDAGIAPAVRPELIFQARISPEHYDGVAPELIGTGNPPDARSEFYALGCLLWQLLAGRPPFPTGDPLAKLKAHQTRRIPDVRDIAPDTPAELAGILRAFTEPDPSRRPPSFRAFRSRWGSPKRPHRRQIARFRAMFNTAIPHIPSMTPETVPNRWPVVAAMLFLLSGASLSLMDAGAYSRLLAIPQQLQAYMNAPETIGNGESPEQNTDAGLGKPLPLPDANGLIELPDAGPYRWSQIDTIGPLTIRGTAGVLSEIVIADSPCQISAADVVLENLLFRPAPAEPETSPVGTSKPLLQVTSSSLALRNCGFQLAGGSPGPFPSREGLGVEWKHIDPANSASGRVAFENCLFHGAGTGCQFRHWPSHIAVRNCLKTDAGVLFDFAAEEHSSPNVQWKLSQVTLRGATGLSRCELGPNSASATWLVQAENCVFDLHAPPSALFEISGASAGRFLKRLQLQGKNCLLNDSATVASVWNPVSQQFQPLDSSSLSIGGVVLARLVFAGPQTHRPADSELATWQGPRFSATVPGIHPAELPQWSEKSNPPLFSESAGAAD